MESPGHLGFDSSWTSCWMWAHSSMATWNWTMNIMNFMKNSIPKWLFPQEPPMVTWMACSHWIRQLTKPEASLSRKMLCSGSQEIFSWGSRFTDGLVVTTDHHCVSCKRRRNLDRDTMQLLKRQPKLNHSAPISPEQHFNKRFVQHI